jgi:methionine sulfoxide reductase heme-binding subunit
MMRSQPLRYVWLLISSASGIVALVLISAAVVLGLAMAARALRRPGHKRAAARLHEHIAMAALAAIAAHGLALLGDHWLKPGWRGIAIPFALSYRPVLTGSGIIAGYLAVLLGPTFYLRRRIGARRWRTLHRATVIVWVLSAVHALGAGTDGTKLWLRVIVLTPVAPIVYLLVLRLLGTERTPRASAPGGARPQARRRDQRDRVSEPEPARS